MLRTMKKPLLAAATAALLSFPAFAQDVQLKISLPWLTPPPLVVVEPGIQVVPDYEEEIFFVDNWYWVRRDGRWWRTRDYHGGWAYMPRGVPPGLSRIPPGKYRHWKAEKAAMKAENRELKREIKEDRREEKREEKHEEKGGGWGHGHKK